MIFQEDILSNPVVYKPQGKLNAYCDSYVCFPTRSRNQNTTLGVKKDVSKSTISCPQCSSALYWIYDSQVYTRKKKP